MKRKTVFSLIAVLLALVIVGCAAVSELVSEPASTPTPVLPTDSPVPTVPPQPTEPPPPTATPEPQNTPLPEGVLFRDDFEGSLQQGWEWMNEDPEKWSFSDDGMLQIVGRAESLLHDQIQFNILWHDLPDGDFQISAHLKAAPVKNFQQATIYFYQDPDNYVAINRGYCSVCDTGGGGFYMEHKIDGAWGAYTQATSAEDVWLRLVSKDNMIAGYYATTEDDWKRLGRFGDFFQFKRVGIGVTNVGADEDLIGKFDWFEISVP